MQQPSLLSLILGCPAILFNLISVSFRLFVVFLNVMFLILFHVAQRPGPEEIFPANNTSSSCTHVSSALSLNVFVLFFVCVFVES